jgi:hypothetical protein
MYLADHRRISPSSSDKLDKRSRSAAALCATGVAIVDQTAVPIEPREP